MERNRRSYLTAADTRRRQMRYGSNIIPRRDSTPVSYPSEEAAAIKSQPAITRVERTAERLPVAEPQAQPVPQPAFAPETAAEGPANIEFNLRFPTFRLPKFRLALPDKKFVRSLKPGVISLYGRAAAAWRRFNTTKTGKRFADIRVRAVFVLLLVVMLADIILPSFQNQFSQKVYGLGSAGSFLTPVNQQMTDKLKLDSSGTYNFNQGYSPQTSNSASATGPQITATAAQDPAKGLTVTDPTHSISFGFTPDFKLWQGKQDGNRVVYPLADGSGWLVYTMHAIGVKEDILLSHATSATKTYSYKLDLKDGLVARGEVDGSLGIYGNTQLDGNVSTGSDADAALLQKARQNAQKTDLLFSIPAPSFQTTAGRSKPHGKYTVTGNELKLTVSGLQTASYPLDIDPSVYVTSASQFMRGNNETNVAFDVADDLIQKGKTTGARIDSWSSTNNLNSAVWGQGTAVAGGYIYSAGGSSGTTTTYVTYYANGTNSWTVPAGVTSVTIQAWGAGGGGGRNSSSSGGDGGGGGYAKEVATVSAGNSLSVLVGSGGSKAAANLEGGNGGGYTSVTNSTTSTLLVKAGAGGGGGGARGVATGGAGGAGGGSTGVVGSAGSGASSGGGGNPGTTTTFGTGGAAGTSGAKGANGAANAGGNAAGGSGTCGTAGSGTGGNGGSGGGGSSGNDTSGCSNGGGGGGGRFGGGGGGSTTTNTRGGGGGGGGSDFLSVSGVETQGSGQTPGNSTDTRNNGAGQGGDGGSTATNTTNGADGGVVISYAVGSAAVTASVLWAHFNTATNEIDSPNPGAGSCSGWCTNSVYDLPVALTNLSLVAYNGFLYALGGENSGGTPKNTIYVAKLGANGEPQLWHASGGTPVYWYHDDVNMTMGSARSKFSALAYNNRLYILGGLTTATTILSSNTVMSASINPTGTLSTFSATGMQSLTSNRYGLGAQLYNGYIYVMGGDTVNVGTQSTPITTVEYAKLNSDGSMNSWQSTNAFSGGRMSMGGSFSAIWGGYLYIGGGCSGTNSVNAAGYCTTIASDVQLASINADGSLDKWNTILGLSNQRIGYTFIAWQNGLYRLGGCRTQDPSTGVCTDTVFDVDYGVINQDGDASTVGSSVASGTAPCSGASPYGCNLPSASVGNVLNETAILNGYLYIMGGCTSDDCTSVSSGVVYESIASDGTLQKPAACTGGTYTDSYCVSPHSLPAGTGAGATAIFNGRIYVVGGFNTKGNINYVSVNSDGSIGTWSSVSLTTIGAIGVTYSYAYARANPSSAGTSPGNLFIFGGCTDGTVGCSNYTDAVYKCLISTAGAPSACSKTANGTQLQIGIIPAQTSSGCTPTTAGLGAMAGAVYANYIYLIGGLTTNNCTDLTTARYAKFDNNNNVVAVSGSAWVEGPNQTAVGRRRGAGFGYNGYLYVVGGYDGTSGQLADIEFAKLNVSDGSWGTWNVSSVTINNGQGQWGLSVPVSNSYAYVIGGCTVGAAPSACTSRTNTLQTFQVYNNDSGTAAGYSATNNCGSGSNGPCNTNGASRFGAAATVLNGYMYLAGGCTDTTCATVTGLVSYAPIDANGTVGTWLSGHPLPASTIRTFGKLVGIAGTLYYVGGQSTSGTANAFSDVYYTTGFTAGNPTWNSTKATCGITSPSIPCTGNPRTQFGVAVWNNRIYVIGGYNPAGAPQKTIYVSPPITGGDIATAWSNTSTSLPIARAGLMSVAYANNLYAFGGNDGTNFLNDSEYGSIGSVTAGTITQSGFTVTCSTTCFNPGQVGSKITYADGTTAIINGYTSTTVVSVDTGKTISTGVSYSILDGSVTSWTYTTSLPTSLSDGDAFAANGYMYIIGGRSAATTCNPITLVAPISANTAIVKDAFGNVISGNAPTGVGEWYQTNQNYTGGRYGAAATYSGGRAYIFDGGCSSLVSAADRNYSTTLLSQPQIAQYSIMIDADSDVYPSKYLLNGIDNGVGASWQLSYQSMKNTTSSCLGSAMTTWGQATNVGNVTLGTPGTYTPLDGSGTNTSCARFFYLSVSIDASQTFGYPEDITRGPTINDLTLQFTSDPSKRLMHGRTFIGGVQQPDDAPF